MDVLKRIELLRKLERGLPGAGMELRPWAEDSLELLEGNSREIQNMLIQGDIEEYPAFERALRFWRGRPGFVVAENISQAIKWFHPDPSVYYFGIGHPDHNLDIVSPLITFDFSTLVGTDILPCAFRDFTRAVKNTPQIVPSPHRQNSLDTNASLHA